MSQVWRPSLILTIGAALELLSPIAAGAETLADLREAPFATLYGEYGPGGDCRSGLTVTIDATGFAFRADGIDRHSGSFEYASSFFGPDYDGISFAFFPFPINADEPGHILLFANADEVAGRLDFTSNLGPRETMSALEARLVAASPFQRCVTQ